MKNSKCPYQNTKGVLNYPSCFRQTVVKYGFPKILFTSSWVRSYIICGFKGKASSTTKVYGFFLFSFNPEIDSGCGKFNNLISVAILSPLLLNIPPSLCLPALPMSTKKK